MENVSENLKMAFLEQSKSFFSQLPDWNGVAVSASSEISLEDQENQALQTPLPTKFFKNKKLKPLIAKENLS